MQAALGTAFEVRGLVGRGGFGEVWAALDVPLSRDVAVKVLHSSLSSNHEYRERFRREARAIARLRHPGIVPIYHVGESNGLVYFVMPLVKGLTLKAALAEPGGLPADEALRILLETVAALKEAHAHGIVHRDLKPENIMLEGPQRRALIMDFGVAKVEEPDAEDLTETDMVVGSPEYMSPEQATGRELDARSDIYSIGVVAYRMLAGRLPFNAASPREVLAHHVLSSPVPISTWASLPESLSGAVMRCLAKNPLERWQSADDLLRALTAQAPRDSIVAALAPRPVETRAETPAMRRAFSRRRIAWAAGLGALALAVSAPVAYARWRLQGRWAAAAANIGAQLSRTGDSLATLAMAFNQADISAVQYLEAREDLLAATELAIDERYGAEIDDSLSWSDSTRAAVREAHGRMMRTDLSAVSLALRSGERGGCTIRPSRAMIEVADEASGDNCWFQASGSRGAAAPVEFAVRARLATAPSPDAGFGIALCRSNGDCRVAFVWPRALVWGTHRPQRGLRVHQSGPHPPLLPGTHELRVRYQDGMLRAWLDGGLVMERRASAEEGYFTGPGSVHFVVQNMLVELPAEGLAFVGRRTQN